MNLSRLASLACISAPLCLALTLPADELAFRPAAKSEVSKTLKIDLELSVTDASFSMNGEPGPPEATDSLKENSLILNLLVGVTDKYVETKDGKPLDLLRTFDKLKVDAEFGENSKDVEEVKEFEGKTVHFKWNEKDGVYDKTYEDSKGDADELKSLDPDMDLRCLLPDKKVSKGDTWEVPAARLATLFLPGGFFSKGGDGEQGAELEKLRKEVAEQFETLMKDFKVACTYKGTKDQDGTSVGEIAFTFDGKAKMDLGSMLEQVVAAMRQEGTPEMDIKAGLGLGLKGDGTLLWDAAAGHAHSFEMQAETDIDVDVNIHAQQGDQPFDIAMTAHGNGKVNWDLSSNSPKSK